VVLVSQCIVVAPAPIAAPTRKPFPPPREPANKPRQLSRREFDVVTSARECCLELPFVVDSDPLCRLVSTTVALR